MFRARALAVGLAGCAVVLVVVGGAVAADIHCEYGAYCNGTDDADTMEGTDSKDIIIGYPGDDTIRGMAGDDLINGFEGDDRVEGGAGDDAITADQDDDVIIDDTPNDADSVYAGSGADRINVRDGDGRDKVSCGAHSDKVIADPGDNVDPRCERIADEAPLCAPNETAAGGRMRAAQARASTTVRVASGVELA